MFSSVAAFNTVTLASICMVIVLADGPFLQRAVTIVQITEVGQSNTTIPLSSSPFIQGATGIIPGTPVGNLKGDFP